MDKLKSLEKKRDILLSKAFDYWPDKKREKNNLVKLNKVQSEINKLNTKNIMATKKKATAKQLAARKKFAAAAKAGTLKKKSTKKKAVKKAAAKKVTKKKVDRVKRAPAKDKCAVGLGRKGGKATKAKRVGIFSAKYKAKKKAASKRKPASKSKQLKMSL